MSLSESTARPAIARTVSALFAFVVTFAWAGLALASPEHKGGGEANLVLPDLGKVTMLGMSGSMLLTAGADGSGRLWNVTPPAEAGRVPCDAEPVIRTFTPAGRRWSTAGGFVPEICSPRLRNPDDGGRGVITDPDNNYSASIAGIDVVRVRKRGDEAAIAELVHADPIDWDAVQARLIKGGMTSQRAYLPEIARMKDNGSLHVEALSSSGKYVITTRDADEALRVWDTATRTVVMKEEISKKALVLDFLTDRCPVIQKGPNHAQAVLVQFLPVIGF